MKENKEFSPEEQHEIEQLVSEDYNEDDELVINDETDDYEDELSTESKSEYDDEYEEELPAENYEVDDESEDMGECGDCAGSSEILSNLAEMLDKLIKEKDDYEYTEDMDDDMPFDVEELDYDDDTPVDMDDNMFREVEEVEGELDIEELDVDTDSDTEIEMPEDIDSYMGDNDLLEKDDELLEDLIKNYEENQRKEKYKHRKEVDAPRGRQKERESVYNSKEKYKEKDMVYAEDRDWDKDLVINEYMDDKDEDWDLVLKDEAEWNKRIEKIVGNTQPEQQKIETKSVTLTTLLLAGGGVLALGLATAGVVSVVKKRKIKSQPVIEMKPVLEEKIEEKIPEKEPVKNPPVRPYPYPPFGWYGPPRGYYKPQVG